MIPASDLFINQLKSNPLLQIFVKLELYDSSMSYIKEITQQVTRDSVGSISVDSSRSIRRNFTFTLINENNEFTWGESSEIWIDKRIRLYIGLKLSNGSVEYVPQGVYILTSPSTSHSFNGVYTEVTGQDKAYLMTGSQGQFINQLTIQTGAKITDAIKIIANDVGETLYNFDVITTTVPYEITFESGSERWAAIQQLAELAECKIFYDVDGYLRLKKVDLNELQNYSPVWTFDYDSPSETMYAGNVRRLDEGILANDIVVLGGSGQTAISSYRLTVDSTNPLWTDSPYAIQRIGRKTYYHNSGNPDSLITTNDQCKWRAKYELMNRLGYHEKVNLQSAPLYLIEPDDVISVSSSANGVSGRYLIERLDIPISPQLMSIDCFKEHLVIADWDFI